ncbi:MAG: hypothetical protein C3F13_12980 [Anaerolineales bacterium]|nr:MAG: hypothetical protein C3F13_12980 [Anaerolineales bacterium]
MPIKIVNTLNDLIWRDFIEAQPQANVYHTPEMFQVFSNAEGHQPALWAAIKDDGTLLAMLLPVQVSLQNGSLHAWTTRAVVYGSVLTIQGEDGADGLRFLLREYNTFARGKFLLTELRNQSPIDSIQPVLSECGYAFEEHLNYLVNLDVSEDVLWHGLSKSCRQRVHISIDKGTIVQEVSDSDQLEAAYGKLQSVYQRVHVPLAHISLFKAALDICSPLEMCKVFIASVDNTCIGACFNLIYNGRMHAWYSGSDRAYAAYNPNELLKWHSFLWGKAHGCHTFDFGGAGRPNEAYGPRAFKAKFGGELVNYGRNVCVHSPLRYQISKTIYRVARKISTTSPKPCQPFAKQVNNIFMYLAYNRPNPPFIGITKGNQ